MQVDHIIPEELGDKPEFDQAKRDLGLPADFDLNSYSNWMPAHGGCNQRKGSYVFDPSPMILRELGHARKKAARAVELEEMYGGNRRLDLALNSVLDAYEKGTLTDDQRSKLAALFEEFHVPNREPEVRGEPVLIAPWLKVLRNDGRMLTVAGPSGMVGVRPVGTNLHSSWDCPRCGPTGWTGARCVTCGMFDDGD